MGTSHTHGMECGDLSLSHILWGSEKSPSVHLLLGSLNSRDLAAAEDLVYVHVDEVNLKNGMQEGN